LVKPVSALAAAQAAFTVVFGFQIGAVTSWWNTSAVLIAVVATGAVVAGCFLIAFFTKLDLTR
jgi:FtsH-binding integral membrane protein